MDKVDVYAILVKQHEKMLLAYVLGLVRDPDMAEEVAQGAFVQAYHKLEALRDRAAFAPWLRAIARNLALAELKRRGREVATEPEVIQGMEDVFAHFDRTVLGDTWTERVRLVRDCFGRLPETLKSACQLHYMEDLTAAAIAERLRVGLAGVLKRLERARIAIRQCVERRLALGDSPGGPAAVAARGNDGRRSA